MQIKKARDRQTEKLTIIQKYKETIKISEEQMNLTNKNIERKSDKQKTIRKVE